MFTPPPFVGDSVKHMLQLFAQSSWSYDKEGCAGDAWGWRGGVRGLLSFHCLWQLRKDFCLGARSFLVGRWVSIWYLKRGSNSRFLLKNFVGLFCSVRQMGRCMICDHCFVTLSCSRQNFHSGSGQTKNLFHGWCKVFVSRFNEATFDRLNQKKVLS